MHRSSIRLSSSPPVNENFSLEFSYVVNTQQKRDRESRFLTVFFASGLTGRNSWEGAAAVRMHSQSNVSVSQRKGHSHTPP
mmetsp:Transcript_14354/g.28858  ORF Transcript_14354/g.28858 Transcript_14354/m.28858 type:complete len:81 (+) Transcript_14354:75-317(+)